MGYAISWLAINGKSPEAILAELHLTPTGKMTCHSDAAVTGRALPNGWFLLVMDESEHAFITPESLAAITSDCEAVACTIEEHVMVSTATLWRHGEQIWRIEHDSEQGIAHLNTSGLLPDSYADLEKRGAEKQRTAQASNAGVDHYFEIPLQTAKIIVGFKHDEVQGDTENFEIFNEETSSPTLTTASTPAKKPWWKPW